MDANMGRFAAVHSPRIFSIAGIETETETGIITQ